MVNEKTTATTDPTLTITTLDEAINLAAHLMHRNGDNDDDLAIWRCIAVPLLAAILYDVSPAGRGGGGLARGRIIAANPQPCGTDATANWLTVASSCPDEHLATKLRNAAGMELRQRNSIRKTLLEALADHDDPDADTPAASAAAPLDEQESLTSHRTAGGLDVVTQVVQSVVVYADLSDHQHLTVIASDVTSQLRSPQDDSDMCSLLVPADAGAFGNELDVSIKFCDLARFVHTVENARSQIAS